MRWTTPFIVACLLLAGSPRLGSAAAIGAPGPQPRRTAEEECLRCHPSARGVLQGAMATRAAEAAFATRAFGKRGQAFFATACGGCHVRSCTACHADAVRPGRPADEACLRCHRGYFVGWDYYGRAPREDHSRYQRGPVANGEPYLKMLPDVHQQRGIGCADCHTMASLQEGRTAAKTCRDCHPRISNDVPEHAVRAHLEKMECQACHAAWASQEYGTFLVLPETDVQRESFAPLPAWGEWRKSTYLRRQDLPPLGLNEQGKVSPIRPQFILFATEPGRKENELHAAEWKTFSPHTIRRGGPGCDACHASARRFLLERDEDRLYRPDLDGLTLGSFWNSRGQTIRNGSFFPPDRFAAMNRKSPGFTRGYLTRWKQILGRVAPSSGR
jgi:hypothetical protein